MCLLNVQFQIYCPVVTTSILLGRLSTLFFCVDLLIQCLVEEYYLRVRLGIDVG